MELTRKQVIEILEKTDCTVYKEPKTVIAQALEYAMADVRKMEKLNNMVKMYEQKGHASTRTISMEDLKEFL